MNDFLKNLRPPHRGAPQRPSGPTRKEIGERYGQGNERRKIGDRREPFLPQSQYRERQGADEYLSMITETLSNMATTLDKLVESQKSLMEVQIKQHESISAFFDNLNQLLVKGIVPEEEPPPIQKKGTTSYAFGTHHTKDEVIEIIRSMREQRSTFAEIAQALTDKGIPTFSGRGDWHAQTIHRLCRGA